MGRVAFFLSEAFRALRRSAAPSVAAIVTVAITTVLLGVLVPVLRASESKTQDVREQIGVNVYLYDDASKAELASLERRLNETQHVTAVDFCSKTCAKKALIERLGDDSAFRELNS